MGEEIKITKNALKYTFMYIMYDVWKIHKYVINSC